MTAIERTAAFIDDRLNPIVVKELRQAVQSRLLVSAILLFMIVTILFFLFTLGEAVGVTQTSNLGRQAFQVLVTVLTATAVIIVPTYTGLRMAKERFGSSADLLFITAIKPVAIVRGKLFAGMVLTLLLFSAAMPFVALSYLLRGLDVVAIFVVLLKAFILIMVVVQFALFIGCIPCSRVFRVLLWGITGFLIFISFTVAYSYMMMSLRYGYYGRPGMGVPYLGPSFFGLFTALLVAGFLYRLSVALLTPQSANRAFWMRIYVTSAWLITGAFTFWQPGRYRIEYLAIWFLFSVVFLSIGFMASASENDAPSPRVARTIPMGRLKRIPAFFFYSGSANGIALFITLLVATFLFAGYRILLDGDRNTMETLNVMAGAALYIYCYSMTALFIHRRFLKARVRAQATWAIALLVFAFCSLAPYIVGFLLGQTDGGNLPVTEIGNIFDLGNPSNRILHLLFAGAWAAVLTVFGMGWFLRQVRSFAPPRAAVEGETS